MTTSDLAIKVKKTTKTISKYAKDNNIGRKISERFINSAYVFTDKEAQKIINHFTEK